MNVENSNSPLERDINCNYPITLSYLQNSFSIELAVLEYNFNNLNEFSYRLEGFDENWQMNGTDRKLKFTNLSPGKYKLQIRATNHDGIWIDKGNVLEINIVPSFWQTTAFKYLLAVLIFLIAFGIHRLRTKFLINQRNKLEMQVEARTAELNALNQQLDFKNNEIQAQNEELVSQNEHISNQKRQLEKTQKKLQEINEKLEKIVEKRTEKLEKTIKQLDHTVDELDKTVKELDRFVYSASHDFFFFF